MGILQRLGRQRRITRSLLLGEGVAERLFTDSARFQRLCAGEAVYACVLSLSLDEVSSWLQGQRAAREVVALLKELGGRAVEVLLGGPAVVTTANCSLVQALYWEEIAGAEFASCAVQAADSLVATMDDWRSALEELPITAPRIGIDLGETATGIAELPSGYQFLAVGKPVALSRLLAATSWHGRFHEPVLLAEEAGLRIEGARPLAMYQTPGFEVHHMMYCLPSPEARQLSSGFIETYARGLQLLYAEQSPGEAAAAFEQCLTEEPEDEPARRMLESCRESDGGVVPGSYRVL